MEKFFTQTLVPKVFICKIRLATSTRRAKKFVINKIFVYPLIEKYYLSDMGVMSRRSLLSLICAGLPATVADNSSSKVR